MQCWKCRKDIEDLPQPMPFRAVCDFCGSWLHVCVNCKFYRPGMHNSCSVPNTEMVSDRENCNFCDEFKIMESQNQPSETPLSAADRFNSLFKD